MMQINKKQRIPTFLLFPLALIYILKAFPISEYDILNNLVTIVKEEPFSSSNLPITLGSLFSIFVLLLIACLILLGVTSLFFDRLYNYHMVHAMTLSLFTLETIFEVLSFSFFVQTKYFCYTHIINLLLNLLLFVSYLVTFLLFVHFPYKRIKKEVKEESKTEKIEVSEGSNVSSVEEKKDDTEEMIEKIAKEKHLTKEEIELMKKLFTKDK